MATRSRIGIELSNGDVLSVYHHWDGYPQWLGKTLLEHFNTTEKVSELIDGGDMSVCWTEDRWEDKENHEYGPQYYSGRGEDCPPRVNTLVEYMTDKETSEEYHYLWSPSANVWTCRDMCQFQDDKPQFVDIPVD
jgi:hypothetical protein